MIARLQYPGPLGIDGLFDGTAFPVGNFQAPLGAEFQAIPEFTGNASVDLATLVPTAKVRIGDRGMAVYRTPLSFADQLRVDRVLGLPPYISVNFVELTINNENLYLGV